MNPACVIMQLLNKNIQRIILGYAIPVHKAISPSLSVATLKYFKDMMNLKESDYTLNEWIYKNTLTVVNLLEIVNVPNNIFYRAYKYGKWEQAKYYANIIGSWKTTINLQFIFVWNTNHTFEAQSIINSSGRFHFLMWIIKEIKLDCTKLGTNSWEILLREADIEAIKLLHRYRPFQTLFTNTFNCVFENKNINVVQWVLNNMDVMGIPICTSFWHCTRSCNDVKIFGLIASKFVDMGNVLY